MSERIRQTDITVETWDPEDIFMFAVEHFRQQKHRAMARPGACAYRASGNCKCGYGLFIPESEYRPSFEGNTVVGLYSEEAYIAPPFRVRTPLNDSGLSLHSWASQQHADIADAIQVIHDTSRTTEALNGGLVELRKKHHFGFFVPVQSWTAYGPDKATTE